jgi:hypothetical protein
MNKLTIYYAALSERTGPANDQCYNAMLDVAEHCGANGYKHLRLGYSRTDYARNELTKAFVSVSENDNDLLVMLDADHKHPAEIVSRFAAQDPTFGVVGALAYRRGEPYDPLFFIRANGGLHAMAEFELGPVYQCAIVSTSAIAIRRWVLLELKHKGYLWPWFRYEYPTNMELPSEDMYFGRICEQAGIWHYCDSSMIIPHATVSWVDNEVNRLYLEKHPQQTVTGEVGAKNA